MGVNSGCIDAYAVLERANDTKLQVFEFLLPNTRPTPWTFNLISLMCPDLELTPIEIYDVARNLRI